MKRFLFFLLLSFVVIFASAEMQQGYTKTRGKLDAKGQLIPGQRLSGVIVETDRGKVPSKENGDFEFSVVGGQFILKGVTLDGYILNDVEQLRRTYKYSATPLALVLVKPEEYNAEKINAQKKIIRTLRKTLQEREDEIEALCEEKKITEQEKYALYQKLYADEQNSQKLVEEMAERYAKTDFDQIDEFQRQVTNLIINGELEKADSLLNTKGNIEEQIRENQQLDEVNAKRQKEIEEEQSQLEKSQALSTKTKEDLAARCYSKYEIYATKHKNDSAAYYLELRASIDTTNVEWCAEAGDFIRDYLADYEKAMEYYQRGLRQNNEPMWNGYFLNALGWIYDSCGMFSNALVYYEKSLELWLNAFGEKDHGLAVLYNNIGLIYYNQDQYSNALEYFEKSLEIDLLYGEQTLSMATKYNNIGLVYSNQGDYSKALEYFEKSLEIRLSILGEQHPDVARSYNGIGNVYNDQGDYIKALEYYEKSLEIGLSIFGERHPEVALIYNNIGEIFRKQGYNTKALEYYEKALTIWQDIYGERHPDVAMVYNNIGAVFTDMGEYSKALKYHEKALEIRLYVYGESHTVISMSYNNLGWTYMALGENSKALEFYEKSLAILLSIYGERHPFIGLNYRNIGRIYYKNGDYFKALEFYEKSLDVLLSIFGEQHPDVATSYNVIGLVYDSQGNYTKALEYYEKAIQIKKNIFGNESKEVANTAINIYYVYRAELSKSDELKDKYNDFISEWAFTATIVGEDTPAGKQGMSGEYYLLEFGDWNMESETNLFNVNESLRGQPKDITVMKDGKISRHHFENTIGAALGMKFVGKEEKQRILESYHNWKNSQK